MLIAEIFRSIQGEGRLTGTDSVFVRTAGCNLRCGYCDTPYASLDPQGEEMTPELIRKTTGTVLRAAAAPTNQGYHLPDKGFSLEEHEKRLIRQALARAKHKKAAAARMLGLSRATLRYRMEKYGIMGDSVH